MKFCKKQLHWRQLAQAGERNYGRIQTTIDMSLDNIVSHAPFQVEKNMHENHFRRWLGIFGRRSQAHASSETRVIAETNGASDDVPTITRRKK